MQAAEYVIRLALRPGDQITGYISKLSRGSASYRTGTVHLAAALRWKFAFNFYQALGRNSMVITLNPPRCFYP